MTFLSPRRTEAEKMKRRLDYEYEVMAATVEQDNDDAIVDAALEAWTASIVRGATDREAMYEALIATTTDG